MRHLSSIVMRQTHLILPFLLVSVGLAACAGADRNYTMAKSEAAPGSYYAYGGAADEDEAGSADGAYEPEADRSYGGEGERITLLASADKPTDSGPAQTPKPEPIQRVILYSADLGLYVFDFKKTLTTAVELTKAEGGYMQASTSSSVTLRVPAEKFESLLEKLDKLGDANFRNVTGTDVSEEFLDLTIRLRNAEALRDRLAALLLQAKEVKDALEIEKELARVTGEIEQIKGRIRFLSDRAAFSVITLQLESKTSEQVVVDHIPLPFGWLQQYGLQEILQ